MFSISFRYDFHAKDGGGGENTLSYARGVGSPVNPLHEGPLLPKALTRKWTNHWDITTKVATRSLQV